LNSENVLVRIPEVLLHGNVMTCDLFIYILNEYHTEFARFNHIKSLGPISVLAVGYCLRFLMS